MPRPVKLLIVDDSPFTRHTLARRLASEGGVDVVGHASNGIEALEQVKRLRPDVVTMDIEMPRMDGLAALERLMAENPMPVVMLSSLTGEGTVETLRALELGAVDFFLKSSRANPAGLDEAATDLRDKIVNAARSNPRRLGPRVSPTVPGRPTETPRNRASTMSAVVVIGTSTGGPKALMELLPAIPGNIPAGMLIVQHMPPGFTRSLAERLDDLSPLHVREAEAGALVRPGEALLAPGGYHMTVDNTGRVQLDEGPTQNGVRPAADPAMETIARAYGRRSVGVVLTGMGSDGRRGASYIKRAGGRVAAEDESTSIVFGMPRCVIEDGLADVVVPLPEMAAVIVEMCEQRKAA